MLVGRAVMSLGLLVFLAFVVDIQAVICLLYTSDAADE